MNKIFQNTFVKGLITDIDKSVMPNQNYLYARNARLSSGAQQSTGSIENIKGNSTLFTLPAYTVLIGHVYIRSKLILFTIDNSSLFSICQFNYTSNPVTCTTLYSSTASGYTIATKLTSVSRYENDNVQLVYITDGINPLRSFNIVGNILGKSISLFEALPTVDQASFSLSAINSGNLLTGVVQYYIKLYTSSGSDTVFIGPSPLYPVTVTSGAKQVGAIPTTNTGKAFTITVTSTSTIAYERATAIAMQWDYYTAAPSVRIVSDFQIGNSSTITFVDSGNNVGELIIEDITLINTSLFSANAIASKDNMLFAGGIKYNAFEVESDYDTRVYRFNIQGNSYLYQDDNNRILLEASDLATVQWKYQSWNGNSWYDTSNYTAGWGIPTTHNCINYTNYTDKRENPKYQDSVDNVDCLYIAGGTDIYGAQGPNLVVKIITTIKDTTGVVIPESYNGIDLNTSNNYTAANIALKLRGYQRSEMYRLGILFSDSRGRCSYASWLCDMLMPSSSDYNGTALHPTRGIYYKHLSTTSNGTFYHPLFVEVSFTHLPPTAVKYAKVVMTERTLNNMSITGQGLLTSVGKYNIIESGQWYYDDGVYTDTYWNDYNDRRLAIDYNSSYYYSTVSAAFRPKNIAPEGYVTSFNQLTPLPNYTYSPATNIYKLVGVESLFNNNYSFKEGDYIDIVGSLGEVRLWAGGTLNYGSLSFVSNDNNIVFGMAVGGQQQLRFGVAATVGVSSSDFTYYSGNVGYIIYYTKRLNYFNSKYDLQIPTSETSKYRVKTGMLVDADSKDYTIDNTTYRNYAYYAHPVIYMGYGDNYDITANSPYGNTTIGVQGIGNASAMNTRLYWINHSRNNITSSGLLIKLKDGITSNNARLNDGHDALLVNYVRDIRDVQYGGSEYTDRLTTAYINGGDWYPCVNNSSTIYGTGDVVCNYTEVQLAQLSKDVNIDSTGTTGTQVWSSGSVLPDRVFYPDYCLNGNVSGTIYVPLESIINTGLRYDSRIENSADYYSYYGTREKQGTYWLGKLRTSDAVIATSNFYTQSTNLYLYNSVYSRTDNSTIFFSKPEVNIPNVNDFTIKYSDVKFNNSTINSWLKFKDSNYIQVDSQYGAIQVMIVYKDVLYFWQDFAFGYVSVNERAVISATSGASVSLGTGGILSTPTYISTAYGCSSKDAVVYSNSSMYWYDNNTAKVLRFKDGTVYDLLTTYNVKSVFGNTSTITNAQSLYYDVTYSELLLTFNILLNLRLTVRYITILSGTDNYRIDAELVTLQNEDLQYFIKNAGDYKSDLESVFQPEEDIIVHSCVGNIINFTVNESAYAGTLAVGDTFILPLNTVDTLVFSEKLDQFTALYSIKAQDYITNKDINNNYISYTKGVLYKHDVGEYGKFYGITYPTSIKILINGDYNYTKQFDAVEFLSTSVNNVGVNVLYDTVNKVRAYNDYQNTDWVILTPGDTASLVRRERSWAMQIQRNTVNADVLDNPNIFDSLNLDSTTRLLKERITDKYCIMDLCYNNTNNYKFNLSTIFTTYRRSIR